MPLLSFLALRGRCRHCRAPVSWRYPLVEAANGGAYYLLARGLPPGARALATMAFVTALLVLSLIDLDHMILPDAITLPGAVAGCLAAFLKDSPITPASALASAFAG